MSKYTHLPLVAFLVRKWVNIQRTAPFIFALSFECFTFICNCTFALIPSFLYPRYFLKSAGIQISGRVIYKHCNDNYIFQLKFTLLHCATLSHGFRPLCSIISLLRTVTQRFLRLQFLIKRVRPHPGDKVQEWFMNSVHINSSWAVYEIQMAYRK